ncbi:hypothetical protein ACL6C3_13885 [Capilliphycus salinus ALCB114379]|uniref:hypothetical protein n=1 Tax=Capilliphycus salinus TaxID=2768948 RepID=UPI0039A63E84
MAIEYWKYLSQTLDSQARAKSYFCKVFGIPFSEFESSGLRNLVEVKAKPKDDREFIRQHWAKIDEIERVRKGPGITKRELNALIRERFNGKSINFLSIDELEALIDWLKSKTA